MSRLDDELRFALRREEPSLDFTARVLEQIARRSVERVNRWQRFKALFALPQFRWATLGAIAAILLVVGLLLYPRLQSPIEDQRSLQAGNETDPKTVPSPPGTPTPSPDERQKDLVANDGAGNRPPQPGAPRRLPHRRPAALAKQVSAPKSEGEIAKDRLLLALQIASAKLNEAQRIVRSE